MPGASTPPTPRSSGWVPLVVSRRSIACRPVGPWLVGEGRLLLAMPPSAPTRRGRAEVHPGTRHKHRQSFEKRGGRKREMRGAVGPRVSQLQHHVPVVRHAEPLSRHRRPQRVAAYPFEPRPVPSGHAHRRVQVEAVPAGMAGRRGGNALPRGRLPEPSRASAGRVGERQLALHRRRRQPRQHGRALDERVLGGGALSGITPWRGSHRWIAGVTAARTSATSAESSAAAL